ncbi:hypothetical protein [Hungatella hathewayi]|uniref:hypothetical protein n=1 Tax=Hungatella hathewayi TaxID=154046 RepID=UPI003567DEF8
MAHYKKYDPITYAKYSMNFLTTMTDTKVGNLPYWIIDLTGNPIYAQHSRVDDGELTSSWCEAIMLLQEMIGEEESNEVRENMIKNILSGFHDDGLHYNRSYPWTEDIFASFHEQAYVASFLTTWYSITGSLVAKTTMDRLVEGLRKVVIKKEQVTFWGGSYPYPRKSYYFLWESLFNGKGYDYTKSRGCGEEAVRNHIIIGALTKYYEVSGNEDSLDLAEGLINHAVIESHLFGYNGEFGGHVHSHLWIAIGVARLARIKNDDSYKQLARKIYQYGLRISSSFGFVPQFGNLTPESHNNCESCCIKDMIELALEMIKLGYDEWDVIDRFARNQLVENQIKSGKHLPLDNSLDDTDVMTFKYLDKRIIGGFTGYAEPNSIPMTNKRAIAGCCSGMAPQAHYLVWKNIVIKNDDIVSVNLLIDYNGDYADVQCEYPNSGEIIIRLKVNAILKIRIPEWVGERFSICLNNIQIPAMWDKNYIIFNNAKAGDIVQITHNLQDKELVEHVSGTDYTITWRGNDIVKMLPEGRFSRLYIRDPNYESPILFDKDKRVNQS